MRGFNLWRWSVYPWWLGWRGCWRRQRWGWVGRRWPTIYLGVVKLITGPGPRHA